MKALALFVASTVLLVGTLTQSFAQQHKSREPYDLGLGQVRLFLKAGICSPGAGRLAVDAHTNYFTVGSSTSLWPNGPARWGTIPYTWRGFPPWDGYLVKYDAGLRCLWSLQFTNTYPKGLTVSGSNSVYVVGEFEGTTRFGQQVFRSQDEQDGFLVKLDGDGVVQWARQIAGVKRQAVCAVTVDAFENVYIAGEFRGGTKFGESAFFPNPNTSCNLFVAKFAPDGTMVWVARSFGGWTQPDGIAVDAVGNCYVTGSVLGSPTFGTNTLMRTKGDAFLVKFNSHGECVWAQSPGGSPLRAGLKVAVDSQGDPHMVGIVQGTTEFGMTNLVIIDPTHNTNTFSAKYSSDGQFQWVRQFQWGDFDFGGFVPMRLAARPTPPLPPAQSATILSTGMVNLIASKGSGSLTPRLPVSTGTGSPASALGMPALTMFIEAGELALMWPKVFTGFQLEGSANLSPMPFWEPAGFPPQAVGEYWVVRMPVSHAFRFYRLRAPP